MNNINIYALTKLRVILNDNIYNTNNINELLELLKANTKCDIKSIDYINHSIIIHKDNYLENSLLTRQVCTCICKFLNSHKLDIEIAISEIKREDEKQEVSKVLNTILLGNYVHMIMNIMNISSPSTGSELIIKL